MASVLGQPDFRGGRRRDLDREPKAGVDTQGAAVHQRRERGEGHAVPHRGDGPRRHRETAHDTRGQLRTGCSRQGYCWKKTHKITRCGRSVRPHDNDKNSTDPLMSAGLWHFTKRYFHSGSRWFTEAWVTMLWLQTEAGDCGGSNACGHILNQQCGLRTKRLTHWYCDIFTRGGRICDCPLSAC